MKIYTVKITETLTKLIHIQADSEEEALQTVIHNYNCAEDGYVLSSNNFDGVDFEVEK
jgi:hypothetical protein